MSRIAPRCRQGTPSRTSNTAESVQWESATTAPYLLRARCRRRAPPAAGARSARAAALPGCSAPAASCLRRAAVQTVSDGPQPARGTAAYRGRCSRTWSLLEHTLGHDAGRLTGWCPVWQQRQLNLLLVMALWWISQKSTRTGGAYAPARILRGSGTKHAHRCRARSCAAASGRRTTGARSR